MEREFQKLLEEAKAKIKEELVKLEGELKKLLPADAHSQLAEKVAAAGQAVDTHFSADASTQAATPVQQDQAEPSGDESVVKETPAPSAAAEGA